MKENKPFKKNTKVIVVHEAKIGDTNKYLLVGVKDVWFLDYSTTGTHGLFYHYGIGEFSAKLSDFAVQE